LHGVSNVDEMRCVRRAARCLSAAIAVLLAMLQHKTHRRVRGRDEDGDGDGDGWRCKR
jgi:hypothetical protein